MGELINGRTPEQIRFNVMECAHGNCLSECPYDSSYECTEDLLGDAFALIRHLDAKVPKWISVEERLPENDNLVLVRANGRAREIRWDGAYVLATYGSEGWVLWDYEDDEVQHLRILQWMPLPEPPEEDKHEAE